MPKKNIKDATDEGGSDDVAENPISDRKAIFEQIVDQRNKEFANDTGVEPDTGEEEETEEPEVDEPEGGSDKKDDAPVEAPPDAEKPKKHVIVVDGQEQEVELEKLIEAGKRTLQKESKAEKTLQEAAELKKKYEAQLNERTPSPPQPAEPPPPKPDKDAALKELKANIDEARAEHIKAINYGEEDDVLNAARKYEEAVESYNDFKYGNTNKDEIVREVVQRTKYQDIHKRLATPPDSGGYADIVSNPYLRQWASDEVNKLITGGEPDEYDTYQKACEIVRGALGMKPAKTPANDGGDSPTSTSEKVKRKERIDNLETASARQQPPKEKEESASEVIEQMRRNRVGQTD